MHWALRQKYYHFVAELRKISRFLSLMHSTEHPHLVTCQDRSARTYYKKDKQNADFFFYCEPQNLPVLTINLLKESKKSENQKLKVIFSSCVSF